MKTLTFIYFMLTLVEEIYLREKNHSDKEKNIYNIGS